MPSLEWNMKEFNREWTGPCNDEDWSIGWGSKLAQWSGCIFPRVFPFLGLDTLEIGCGHGRWAEFLTRKSRSYLGIDIAPQCIAYCREHLSLYDFEVCDGYHIPVEKNHSIGFAFSFDSLVHAEEDVMLGYAQELSRVLAHGGVAWLHHSNLCGLGRLYGNTDMVPHRRAVSMSAAKMEEFAAQFGMSCVQQEIVGWGNEDEIDCISTIVNTPGLHNAKINNKRFMLEKRMIERNVNRRWDNKIF